MRTLWLILGLTFAGLGLIGAFLPIVPTVPFMLLAAFFFARSSERLHHWLITHPTFGPPIDDWQRRRAIRRPTKWLATLSILSAFIPPLILRLDPMILIAQAVILGAVTAFIWSRPEA